MYLLKIVQASFLLLPAFSFGQLRLSQDTLLKMYDRQTIIALSNGVMQQGQMQKRSFFSNPLRKAVRTDRMASALFEKANLQGFGGMMLASVGTFPMTVGLFSLKGTQELSQNQATALTIGGAVTLGLGIWLVNKAADGLYETTWVYNRNAILQGFGSFTDTMEKAQLIRRYEQTAIRRSNFGFYQNGRYEMTGLFGFDDPLKDRLRPNGAAYNLYRRGDLYRTAGRVGNAASVVGSLVGLSKIVNADFKAKPILDGMKWSLLSLVLSLASSALLVNGEDEIQRAVWFYNRDAFARGVF